MDEDKELKNVLKNRKKLCGYFYLGFGKHKSHSAVDLRASTGFDPIFFPLFLCVFLSATRLYIFEVPWQTNGQDNILMR